MNENIRNKSSWGFAFTIASMWFGTHVGAGFATGNQVVGYFSKYGGIAPFFPILAMGILALGHVCLHEVRQAQRIHKL